MTKLYYTDPLKAAYMAREFGVKLLFIEHYGDDKWETEITWEGIIKTAARYGIGTYELSRLYVHPDSLDIFKPKEGDLVTIRKDDFGATPFVFRGDLSDWDTFERHVLFRDKKHFFMPEDE